ncbi:endonuclease III [Thermithiobacillus plumbiphilus]|uniref:Endonuclease III n=1 Tax=Thermithiobacillus plumbiphilus TaxID=1729899 RepID=A0ABU9D986_9PROT
MQVPQPGSKRPFEPDLAFARIAEAVQPFPKAALFELADEGFRSPFEQLLACIISIRTRDETTLPAARRLFALARTPAQLLALDPAAIYAAILPATFHETKARQMRAIAAAIEADHGGELPCARDTLLSFQGVGPKCANLSLGIACGLPLISVDIHVHRVVNRWGYVQAKTPEQTLVQLDARLPMAFRVAINRLLVPFGKHICTGQLPRCSSCPVLDMCQQIGVNRHR